MHRTLDLAFFFSLRLNLPRHSYSFLRFLLSEFRFLHFSLALTLLVFLKPKHVLAKLSISLSLESLRIPRIRANLYVFFNIDFKFILIVTVYDLHLIVFVAVVVFALLILTSKSARGVRSSERKRLSLRLLNAIETVVLRRNTFIFIVLDDRVSQRREPVFHLMELRS